MALKNALLIADVAHARQVPKKNAFRYGVYYLCFALKDKARLALSCLSLGRFNLFGFYDHDHGDKTMTPESWIQKALAEWGLKEADGDVVLLTMPRVLGYVFNPVSFWFCLDKQGNLRAVLSEVTNTFKDRHCYISFHDDHRPISRDDWLGAEKIFYVSPFLPVEGSYQFRFAYGEEKLGVWINYYQGETLMLTTSLTGKRIGLTSANLIKCFFRYPLVTLKVITLIHYQALKIVCKGIRHYTHPKPPSLEISR